MFNKNGCCICLKDFEKFDGKLNLYACKSFGAFDTQYIYFCTEDRCMEAHDLYGYSISNFDFGYICNIIGPNKPINYQWNSKKEMLHADIEECFECHCKPTNPKCDDWQLISPDDTSFIIICPQCCKNYEKKRKELIENFIKENSKEAK